MITVTSGNPGKVGLWERHPDHPGGEAFVASRPVEVAETPAVQAALKDGRLVEVKAAVKPEPAPEPEPKPSAKRTRSKKASG